ncbi:MAG: alpha/beta hydrolase fold domain-containing protein [Gammaproteobacteria bacterium]
MHKTLVTALLLATTFGAQAQDNASKAREFRDVIYAEVDGKPLGLDLYVPRADAPLVVYVHGGAWRAGTKADGVPQHLLDAGFAVASLDFRQSTDAPFPANVHDIKAGIRFLRANAAEYGYDAGKILITGASSGAHLAILVGVTNGNADLEGNVGTHPEASSDVQAILSYFAATDLTTILSQSTPFGVSVREPSLKLLLGDTPDKVPELAQLASPVYHVDANDPPLLLLHGDRDPQMPVNQSLQMLGVYAEHGLDVEFIPVHGAAHGGPLFNEPKYTEPAVVFARRTIGDAQQTAVK